MLPASLINQARSGILVPLIGSGLSQASGIASWVDLVNTIRDFLGQDPSAHLDFMTLDVPDQLISRAGGRDELAHLLKDAMVRGFLPNRNHEILNDIPFRSVLTTNWDSLIEDELEKKSHANIIFDDKTARTWRESVDRQVIKFHGTVNDIDSVVFGLKGYASLYQSPSRLMSLVRTIISTRPIIAIGFGMADPFVKALFQAMGEGNHLQHFLAVPEREFRPENRAIYESLGFEPILLECNADDPFGTLGLLSELREESFNRAENKIDRTKLLVRETKRLAKYLGRDKTIRVRAALGPFAAPAHVSNEIFGSEEIHRLELELLSATKEILKTSRCKLRLICNPVDDGGHAISKGYSTDAYNARLRAQLQNLLEVRDRVEIAVSRRASQTNEWIVADLARIDSRKRSSDDDRLYALGNLDMNRDNVAYAARIFDTEFESLSDLNGGSKGSTDKYITDLSRHLS